MSSIKQIPLSEAVFLEPVCNTESWSKQDWLNYINLHQDEDTIVYNDGTHMERKKVL